MRVIGKRKSHKALDLKQLNKRKPWFAERTQIAYHLMMLPGIIVLLIFSYIPMFGLVMAFQKFIPSLGIHGSEWVGLANFKFLLSNPDVRNKFLNSLILAGSSIALENTVPVFIALLLNEVRHKRYKKTIQTVIYLPHFLSWVTLGVIFQQFFSLNGFVNNILDSLGVDSIHFMANNSAFRPMLIVTGIWKSFGWGTIIYLAALTGIDPTQYESARIDGATRLQRIRYITLPGMMPIIILKLILSLGNVLNANFDQVFNLYNPLVYESSDIIDTYIYRMGLVQSQYSLSTAVGMLKSMASTILITLSYLLSNKLTDYRIF